MLKGLNEIITFNPFFILKKYKKNADDDLIVYLTRLFNRVIPYTCAEAKMYFMAFIFIYLNIFSSSAQIHLFLGV